MTLIALHMLQNHAPANLNRDDNGDPKDALFGGVRRARISSQALKRSIRWSGTFRNYFVDTPALLAERTQLLPELVRERIAELDLADDAKIAIVQAAEKFGKADRGSTVEESTDDAASVEAPKRGRGKGASQEGGEQKRKTKQLMFLTLAEVDQLATELVDLYREKGGKAFAELKWDKFREDAREKYAPHAVDIAMFGRMTTSSPFKNIDAAVQVAHALSTHAVEQEFDFYTAVDDISGETGAGFIGETSFNSATYYKYISVDWDELVANLQGDRASAATTVRALIHAALLAIPSGKQNSFAAHNLPDLVLVEARPQKIALSYANAFVKPVRANTQRSLIEASADALAQYIPQINGMYGLHAERAFLSTVPLALDGARQCASLDELLGWLPLSA
jgi:CRISPR system Cascade subunit CasC